MIKKLAWNTFKNTGDINAYLEFTKIENAEEQLKFNEQKSKINLGENIGINTEK